MSEAGHGAGQWDHRRRGRCPQSFTDLVMTLILQGLHNNSGAIGKPNVRRAEDFMHAPRTPVTFRCCSVRTLERRVPGVFVIRHRSRPSGQSGWNTCTPKLSSGEPVPIATVRFATLSSPLWRGISGDGEAQLPLNSRLRHRRFARLLHARLLDPNRLILTGENPFITITMAAPQRPFWHLLIWPAGPPPRALHEKRTDPGPLESACRRRRHGALAAEAGAGELGGCLPPRSRTVDKMGDARRLWTGAAVQVVTSASRC